MTYMTVLFRFQFSRKVKESFFGGCRYAAASRCVPTVDNITIELMLAGINIFGPTQTHLNVARAYIL